MDRVMKEEIITRARTLNVDEVGTTSDKDLDEYS